MDVTIRELRNIKSWKEYYVILGRIMYYKKLKVMHNCIVRRQHHIL